MRLVKLVTSMLGLAVIMPLIVAACGGGGPEELDISVKVEQEQLRPETLRVKQGDMVTLKIEADEAGEFHLHGYDIEEDVSPEQLVDLYFVADATGRFRITFHAEEATTGGEGEHKKGEEEEEEETTIGFVEVQPRYGLAMGQESLARR